MDRGGHLVELLFLKILCFAQNKALKAQNSTTQPIVKGLGSGRDTVLKMSVCQIKNKKFVIKNYKK